MLPWCFGLVFRDGSLFLEKWRHGYDWGFGTQNLMEIGERNIEWSRRMRGSVMKGEGTWMCFPKDLLEIEIGK